MKHPECPNEYQHDKHRFQVQPGVVVGCDGDLIPEPWCGTAAIDEALQDTNGRRCDSDMCDRPVAHIWEAVVDARFSLVIGTRCRFLLCDPHDAFYLDHMTEHRARRII